MIIKAQVIQGKFGKQIKYNNQWYNIGEKDGVKVKVGDVRDFELISKMHNGVERFFANLQEPKAQPISGADFRKAVIEILKEFKLIKARAPAEEDIIPEGDTPPPWEEEEDLEL